MEHLELDSVFFSKDGLTRNDSGIDLTRDFGKFPKPTQDQTMQLFSSVPQIHSNDCSFAEFGDSGTLPPIPPLLESNFPEFRIEKEAHVPQRKTKAEMIYQNSCPVEAPLVPYITMWHPDAVSIALSWFYHRNSVWHFLQREFPSSRILSPKTFWRERLADYTGASREPADGARMVLMTFASCSKLQQVAASFGTRVRALENAKHAFKGITSYITSTWLREVRFQFDSLVYNAPSFAALEQLALEYDDELNLLCGIFNRSSSFTQLLEKAFEAYRVFIISQVAPPALFVTLLRLSWWCFSDTLEAFLYNHSGRSVRLPQFLSETPPMCSSGTPRLIASACVKVPASIHLHCLWKGAAQASERLAVIYEQFSEKCNARLLGIVARTSESRAKFLRRKLRRLEAIQTELKTAEVSNALLAKQKQQLLHELQQQIAERQTEHQYGELTLGLSLYEANTKYIESEKAALVEEARLALQKLERAEALAEWQLARFRHSELCEMPPAHYERIFGTSSVVDYRQLLCNLAPVFERSDIDTDGSASNASSDNDFVSVQSFSSVAADQTATDASHETSSHDANLQIAGNRSELGPSYSKKPRLTYKDEIAFQKQASLSELQSLAPALSDAAESSERTVTVNESFQKGANLNDWMEASFNKNLELLDADLADYSFDLICNGGGTETLSYSSEQLALALHKEFRLLELAACYRVLNEGAYLDFLEKFKAIGLMNDGNFVVKFEDAFFGRGDGSRFSLNWNSRRSVPFTTEIHGCLDHVLPFVKQKWAEVEPYFVCLSNPSSLVPAITATDFLVVRWSSNDDLLDEVLRPNEAVIDKIWKVLVRVLRAKNLITRVESGFQERVFLNFTCYQLASIHMTAMWKANFDKVSFWSRELDSFFTIPQRHRENPLEFYQSEHWTNLASLTLDEVQRTQAKFFTDILDYIDKVLPNHEQFVCSILDLNKR